MRAEEQEGGREGGVVWRAEEQEEGRERDYWRRRRGENEAINYDDFIDPSSIDQI